jgi:AsmA protein
MKSFLTGIALVVLLIVGLVVALPFLIDLNKYQEQYRPLIEEALNRKVTLQDIRLTVWPRIGARVTGFTVLDDPAFSSDPFASLKSLDVGIKLGPLFSGRVEVEEITLQDPVVTVIKNRSGVTNVATLGPARAPKPERAKPAEPAPDSPGGPLRTLALLAVDEVSIIGGRLTYRDLSAGTSTEYVVQDLDVHLDAVRLGATPRLEVFATVLPFKLPVAVKGTFGPLGETPDLKQFDFLVSVGKVAVSVTGSAVAGSLNVTAKAPEINTEDIPITLPLRKPVVVKDFQLAADAKGKDARISQLSLQVFEGLITSQGGVTLETGPLPFNGKLSVQGLQLGPLLDAVGTDKVSVSGTAAMDLGVQGRGFKPAELTQALEGSGHFAVKEATLEGVNPLQEALALLKVAGLSPDNLKTTIFSIVEGDVRIQQGVIHVQRLLADSRDYQALTTGTVGFDRTLNLKTTLNLSEALSGKIAALSPGAKLVFAKGRMTIPLLIKGTTQAPAFSLDAKAIGGRVQEQVREKVEETVGDVLKGKRRPQDLKLKDFLGQ